MLGAVVCSLVVTMVTSVPSRNTRPLAAYEGGGKITLDIEELEKMGISTEHLMEHLKHIQDGFPLCPQAHEADRTLKKYFLSNNTVTCNDGSLAGYYLRKSSDQSRWLVFLEGGWYCFDQMSCQGRWINTPKLMTSNQWDSTRRGSGILSADPNDNPYAYNANLVYVPYCSSDSWSGTYKGKKGEFSFMGSLILEEVIKDLISIHNMGTTEKLILAGSSAGATGVLVNLDRVAAQMSVLAPKVEVRGIADSGWFLDNEQYNPVSCIDAHTCAPTDGVQRGIQLWQGRVPDACHADYKDEPWRCYFGYRLYKTLKTPVFVVQNLFDEAQIFADNVGTPVKTEQWQYIHNMGQDIKHTVMNVSAVFAPACLSHIILTKSEWKRISINSVTLPQALKCWEDGKNERNRYHSHTVHSRRKPSYTEAVERLITGERRRETPIMDQAPSLNKKKKRKKSRHKKRDRDRDRENRDRKERRRKKRKRHRHQQERIHSGHTSASSHKLPQLNLHRGGRHNQQRSSANQHSTGVNFELWGNNQGDSESSSWSFYNQRTRRSLLSDSHTSDKDSISQTRSIERNKRSILIDQHDVHHMEYHDNQCSHHRIDHCAWPQCNFSCPKIRHPFTGEEMDFIDLLMQFGLDLSSIANALNMDLPTLQAMDHDVLLKLLIQQGR